MDDRHPCRTQEPCRRLSCTLLPALYHVDSLPLFTSSPLHFVTPLSPYPFALRGAFCEIVFRFPADFPRGTRLPPERNQAWT